MVETVVEHSLAHAIGPRGGVFRDLVEDGGGHDRRQIGRLEFKSIGYPRTHVAGCRIENWQRSSARLHTCRHHERAALASTYAGGRCLAHAPGQQADPVWDVLT